MITIEGEVIHGAKLGRRMGFPTANMEVGSVEVENGVYLSIVRIDGKQVATYSLLEDGEYSLNGGTNIRMGLETMGKLNQLGTLEEVIELCKRNPTYHPVVDFGHLNARNIGGYFPNCDSYRRIFDKIGSSLGDEYAYNLHCHFSKIEFTSAGEKKHLTFEDTLYGPEFDGLAEAIVREGVCPRIICESAGTMAEDALTMKGMWLAAKEAIIEASSTFFLSTISSYSEKE